MFWAGGAAGGVAALALTLLRPPRGAGAAALGALVASLTAVAGWLVLNTALGGGLTADFVRGVVKTPVALGFVALVAAAVTGLVPAPATAPAGPRPRPRRRRGRRGRDRAGRAAPPTPRGFTPFGGAAAPDGDPGLATTARAAEVELYVTGFAPAAADASLAIDRSVTAIDADTTLPGPTAPRG